MTNLWVNFFFDTTTAATAITTINTSTYNKSGSIIMEEYKVEEEKTLKKQSP